MKTKTLQDTILTWYDNNKRSLPWRDDPTPYRVWISEIMLQQTRVEAVIGYFERFITALPTIKDLAEVSEDQLLKLWQGLGYYNRARNLKKTAIIIQEQYSGVFPNNKNDLLSLPGIGPYTAGAILSIAFDKQEAAIDGNVLRVFIRYLAIQANIEDKTAKQAVRDFVERHLPNTRNSDFTQALMELGAMICLPNGAPRCNICPIQKNCVSHQQGTELKLPLPREKKIRPVQYKTILVYQEQDSIWIKKRPNTGLLASLYEFHTVEEHLSLQGLKDYLKKQQIQYDKITKLPKSTHLFTHLKWDMIGYLIEGSEFPTEEMILVKKLDLKDVYSIPSAYKKYLEYLFSSGA